jgi:hypothetical protein
MKAVLSALLLCATLLCALVPTSHAAGKLLPARDLTVELRQLEEGRDTPGSYSAGRDSTRVWEPQAVQVRNGQKALLRMNDAIPMQWTQSVSTQNQSGNASSTSSNGNATSQASVNNALVWFDAGQSVSVQPQWPGGNQPAVLVIEVQRAAVDPHRGADLPTQSRNTLSTTVTVPLAEWVTIASTGRAAQVGVYSSDAGLLGRRLLQVRVMVP